MNVAKLIQTIDSCYEWYLHMLTLASTSRGTWGWLIVNTIINTPELAPFILVDLKRKSWGDRIQFQKNLIEFFKEEKYIPNVVNGIFQDGVDYNNIPTYKGCYFLGDSRYNPKTNRTEYWVKVGRAINIYNRITQQYFTCCSQLWFIGFNHEYQKEHYYHTQIEKVCVAKSNHNDEWYMVSPKIYFEMCEKGFSYFD